MRVLVIGSGGREHALVTALAADPIVTEIFAAPGNPGIAGIADVYPVKVTDSAAIAGLAVQLNVDLVVIGPEAALIVGATDAVQAAGIACFGPSKAAAQLEGSKAFAKDVMAGAGVATARFHTCTNPDQAAAALDDFGPPYVVKDDGLAGGKGVVVTEDREAALAHAATCDRVVIEEYLDGPEVSLFVITDGIRALPLPLAQDFKRIGDGDTGPNTGGMGAYSPLPWAPKNLTSQVMQSVAEPVIAEMAKRGTPFAGVLYVGLALTKNGPKVVEFNARFGDPETQVVLPLVETGLGGLLHAAATGDLSNYPSVEVRDGAAVTVVVASAGYPENPQPGEVISGADGPGYLHAGTAVNDSGELVTAGGRVLCCTAVGNSVREARDAAYALVDKVSFAGAQYRTDIAQLATS